MKPSAIKTFGSARQMAGYLIRDGKKTGIAMALVAVMAVMWLRVLTGQKPKSAGAKPESAQKAAEPETQRAEMRFVELPVETGRNDRVHRDFFAAEGWSRFSGGSKSHDAGLDTEAQKAAPNRTHEVAARLVKTLKLEAVTNDHAFVNDRLVRVGDKFALTDGADAYILEVVQIKEDAVHMTWEDRQWVLKLSQPTDVKKQ